MFINFAPSKVYAAGSEDMDTLTFNAPILYRHLTFSEAKKQPISEISLEKALEGLEMDRSQVKKCSPVAVQYCGNSQWQNSLSIFAYFLVVTILNRSRG